MATHVITIEGITKKAPHNLILSDKGNTIAQPGDIIQWIVAAKSKVGSILMIQDTSSHNIFSSTPSREDSPYGPFWQGTINPDIMHNESETYNIYYTKTGESTVFVDDPRIQVRS